MCKSTPTMGWKTLPWTRCNSYQRMHKHIPMLWRYFTNVKEPFCLLSNTGHDFLSLIHSLLFGDFKLKTMFFSDKTDSFHFWNSITWWVVKMFHSMQWHGKIRLKNPCALNISQAKENVSCLRQNLIVARGAARGLWFILITLVLCCILFFFGLIFIVSWILSNPSNSFSLWYSIS